LTRFVFPFLLPFFVSFSKLTLFLFLPTRSLTSSPSSTSPSPVDVTSSTRTTSPVVTLCTFLYLSSLPSSSLLTFPPIHEKKGFRDPAHKQPLARRVVRRVPRAQDEARRGRKAGQLRRGQECVFLSFRFRSLGTVADSSPFSALPQFLPRSRPGRSGSDRTTKRFLLSSVLSSLLSSTVHSSFLSLSLFLSVG
jgi:hypothetical protein